MKISPGEESFGFSWIAPRISLRYGHTKRYVSTTEGTAGSGTEMGMQSTSWSWEQDDTAREQHRARNLSLHAQLLSAHPIPHRREGLGKGREG